MSTPALVKFEDNGAIYLHWDGYPEDIIPQFEEFLQDVEKNTKDTRFEDASYLAARYVVWYADRFAYTYDFTKEDHMIKSHRLDFVSIGICDPNKDYGQAYTYLVDCSGDRPKIELIS